MKEIKQVIFWENFNAVKRKEQILGFLGHYSQMKKKEPEKFEGFTEEIFSDLAKTYVSINDEMELEGRVEHFSHIIQNDYNVPKEDADRYAKVSDVLIAAMELKEQGPELIKVMKSFGVGAERKKIDYEFDNEKSLILTTLFGVSNKSPKFVRNKEHPSNLVAGALGFPRQN